MSSPTSDDDGMSGMTPAMREIYIATMLTPFDSDDESEIMIHNIPFPRNFFKKILCSRNSSSTDGNLTNSDDDNLTNSDDDYNLTNSENVTNDEEVNMSQESEVELVDALGIQRDHETYNNILRDHQSNMSSPTSDDDGMSGMTPAMREIYIATMLTPFDSDDESEIMVHNIPFPRNFFKKILCSRNSSSTDGNLTNSDDDNLTNSDDDYNLTNSENVTNDEDVNMSQESEFELVDAPVISPEPVVDTEMNKYKTQIFRERSWSLEECTICYEVMLTDKIECLPCGHKFHVDCVKGWLEEHHTCPNCRKEI